MNSTKEKSKKRGRKPRYGFLDLKKEGDSMTIRPDEGQVFTPADAKRIATAVWLHRKKHPFGLSGRVLAARSIKNREGLIIEIRVVCLKSSLY